MTSHRENCGDVVGVVLDCERGAHRCFLVSPIERDVPGQMISTDTQDGAWRLRRGCCHEQVLKEVDLIFDQRIPDDGF